MYIYPVLTQTRHRALIEEAIPRLLASCSEQLWITLQPCCSLSVLHYSSCSLAALGSPPADLSCRFALCHCYALLCSFAVLFSSCSGLLPALGCSQATTGCSLAVLNCSLAALDCSTAALSYYLDTLLCCFVASLCLL